MIIFGMIIAIIIIWIAIRIHVGEDGRWYPDPGAEDEVKFEITVIVKDKD